MALTGIHFLLTYTCTSECDHCFLYCGPSSKGTFTLAQVKNVLEEIDKVGSINSVCFEGGEAFLVYPVLLEAIRLSSEQGLQTAIETNCFWATSEENATLWLEPLKNAGLDLLDTSNDLYHFNSETDNPAWIANVAAKKLDIKTSTICIDNPTEATKTQIAKGEPVYEGRPKMRGRAVDKLTHGLPVKPRENFTECPFEDLRNPGRIHLDPFGNAHLCQGISMGNIWETPLSALLKEYDPDRHPICGPILKGGPLALADIHGIHIDGECVDTCHYCTKTCIKLLDRFPQYLTPASVYGIA